MVVAVHDIWPDAPIYTSVASKKWIAYAKEHSVKLVTSFMQKLPFVDSLNRFYSILLFHILAMESFDFSDYDVVLSFSSRFAHGVITKPSTKHVCYMNSPGRMFWEPAGYFDHERVDGGWLALPILWMRFWSYIAAQRVDLFIANSRSIKSKIEKYYKRDAIVVYPFADICLRTDTKNSVSDYFLVVTRLAAWKRVDVAIAACIKCGVKLKIVGVGRDMPRLKRISGSNPNIEFLGQVGDERKTELLLGCQALINTQAEDFGIVPIEAMFCGKPVIAYVFGGALETVQAGITGEFFCEQTAESLLKVLTAFDYRKYSQSNCVLQARNFSRQLYERNLKQVIRTVYLGVQN